MSSPAWAMRFGLSENDFAELQNQLAGQDEPLRWCLLNGRVPLQEYLQWAAVTFELPVLRENFFQIPADPIFWEAVKEQFPWTPSFFPLAEWQGVLLIGCLEAPKFHFPDHHQHRFVLASAVALEKRFREHQPTWSFAELGRSSTPQPAFAQAPAPAPVLKVRQRPDDEVLAEDLPPAPDVSLEDPDGIAFEVPPASTPNLFVVPDGLPVDDIGQPLPVTPDGLDQDSVLMNMADLDFSQAEPAKLKVKPPTETDTKPAPQTETKSGINLQQIRPMPFIKPTAPPVAPPMATPATPAMTANASNVADDANEEVSIADAVTDVTRRPLVPPKLPPMSPVAPPLTPAAPSGGLSKIMAMPLAPNSAVTPPPLQTIINARVPASEPVVALSTCLTYDALLSATVAQITTVFEHAMVFSVARNQLQPQKWSELLLSVKGDKPDSFSLEDPSIFRIPFRTSLPYHGYVVANPINTAFFNAFNRGMLARHVTIIPIIVNGQIESMLMGLSLVSVDIKSTLLKMDKIGQDFAVQLERFRAKKAA